MSVKSFERRTVFISCSQDMVADADIVRQVVGELNLELPEDDRWEPFYWQRAEELWSASMSWPEQIPRASAPNVRVVVSLLGERVGRAVPDEFKLPEGLTLPSWVCFPWRSGDKGVPMTGTVLEILDALCVAAPRGVRVLRYVKADPTRMRLHAKARLLGFQHWFRKLSGKHGVIEDEGQDAEYAEQLAHVACLLDHLEREARPGTFFGKSDASPEECREELRKHLLRDLSIAMEVERKQRTFRPKGLRPYEPEDADFLIGRDDEVKALLQALLTAKNQGKPPLLVLRGRNGEGKSSLLRAGLVGPLGVGRHYSVGAFRPVLCDALSLGRERPLERMCAAIGECLGDPLWGGAHGLEHFAREGWPQRLVEELRARLTASKSTLDAEPPRLFLALDQLEELLLPALDDTDAGRALAESLHTLFRVILELARAELAWVVLALPDQHVERLQPFLGAESRLRDFRLHPPGGHAMRRILEQSFALAGVPLSASEVDRLAKEADAWVSEHEQKAPGPVLPLLSALIHKLVALHVAARAKRSGGADGPSIATAIPPISLREVVEMLGEDAWQAARKTQSGFQAADPEAMLRRLLRQLVSVSFIDRDYAERLEVCREDHPALREAQPLVDALRGQRLLYAPEPGGWRLAHISLLQHWSKAKAWLAHEQVHLRTLARLKQSEYDGHLLREPADLDRIEDLWLAWRDDEGRLPTNFMRRSLLEAFQPASLPDTRWREDGSSRLVAASFAGDPLLLSEMLERVGRMPERARAEYVIAVGPGGETALHGTALHGNAGAAGTLIGHAPRSILGHPGPRGARALDAAAQEGHLDVVRVLVEADPTLVSLPGFKERSVLEAAAFHGHLEMVKFLLAPPCRAHVDLTHRGPDGSHALDAAAQAGHLDVVRMLVETDPALVSLPGFKERSVLEAAAVRGHLEMVKFLLAPPCRAHVDLTHRQPDGTRALDWAAQEGHLDVVRVLVEADPALVSLPGFEERSVLEAAAVNGHLEMVKFLLAPPCRAHVDLTHRRPDGTRALDAAAQEGHLDVVRVLVEADSSLVSLPGHGERSVLEAAAYSGKVEVIELLLRCRTHVDLSHRGTDGMHALETAAQEGHLDVVRLLVEQNRSLLALPGAGGRSVIEAAASNGHEKVVRFLSTLS